ncbi:MAG TPA: response regulator, partial [Chthoniobacterales bacterium]
MSPNPSAIKRPRILVAEDEPSIRDAITYPLESDGCEVRACGTGAEILQCMAAAKFDVLILDIGLPDMTGFEVCKKIRERHSLPILFLTARADEIDRVVGLEIGGDDYVTKPFSPRELSARVRALLRRIAREDGAAPAVSSVLVVNEERFVVHYHG